jgi:hypothetical protein
MSETLGGNSIAAGSLRLSHGVQSHPILIEPSQVPVLLFLRRWQMATVPYHRPEPHYGGQRLRRRSGE